MTYCAINPILVLIPSIIIPLIVIYLIKKLSLVTKIILFIFLFGAISVYLAFFSPWLCNV